jgi:M3 family oligoendopeptidase
MTHLQRFSNLESTRPELSVLSRESTALLSRWDSAADEQEQLALIENWQDSVADFQTRSNIAYARFAQDTGNPQYKADKTFFDEVDPDIKEMNLAFKRRVLASPNRSALEKRYGSHVFKTWELELTTFDPVIADDERAVSKRVNEYCELMASIRVDFQGREWTLSSIRGLTGDGDRSVREGAQKATQVALQPHQEAFDSFYDELTGLRHEMSRKMGHSSYTPLGYGHMGRTDYGPEEVEVFRSQVRELLVPLCQRIWARRAQNLGVDRLHYWDESVRDPQGEPCPKGDRSWMVDQATRMFDSMQGEFGDFFRMLREHELMDLDSREGKQGGGFCMDLPQYGVPFIFANFVGTQADVRVFTHECGHAYQNWQASRVQPLLEYRWPTSEAAEIHSMSLEFLTHPHMELFFEEDASRFREGHLEGALLFIPYGCAIDHFQHMVYANPSATPDDRAAMWQECERLYLPHRNYEGLPVYQSGRFWQRQRHIYVYPFYYIDYCLAQTVALQFWHASLQDRAGTMERYQRLCVMGGSKPFTELVSAVDLASPLQQGSLAQVVQTASERLGLA